MRRVFAPLLAIALCAAGSAAFALYMVSEKGEWPKTWPKELESLRKQSRTLVGPEIAQSHYLIPFTKREEFEAAWPHLLKVKSTGAPIILVPGPRTDFFAVKPAGVVVRSPPADPLTPEAPIAGVKDVGMRWMNTTYIELAVDGKIVDLNRIELPADTPIIDQRFKKEEKKE